MKERDKGARRPQLLARDTKLSFYLGHLNCSGCITSIWDASNILNGIFKVFLKWLLSPDTNGIWGHPGHCGVLKSTPLCQEQP